MYIYRLWRSAILSFTYIIFWLFIYLIRIDIIIRYSGFISYSAGKIRKFKKMHVRTLHVFFIVVKVCALYWFWYAHARMYIVVVCCCAHESCSKIGNIYLKAFSWPFCTKMRASINFIRRILIWSDVFPCRFNNRVHARKNAKYIRVTSKMMSLQWSGVLWHTEERESRKERDRRRRGRTTFANELSSLSSVSKFSQLWMDRLVADTRHGDPPACLFKLKARARARALSVCAGDTIKYIYRYKYKSKSKRKQKISRLPIFHGLWCFNSFTAIDHT